MPIHMEAIEWTSIIAGLDREKRIIADLYQMGRTQPHAKSVHCNSKMLIQNRRSFVSSFPQSSLVTAAQSVTGSKIPGMTGFATFPGCL